MKSDTVSKETERTRPSVADLDGIGPGIGVDVRRELGEAIERVVGELAGNANDDQEETLDAIDTLMATLSRVRGLVYAVSEFRKTSGRTWKQQQSLEAGTNRDTCR